MENIKVNISDHGTWRKHLIHKIQLNCTFIYLYNAIYIEILPKLHTFLWSIEICMLVTPTVEKKSVSSHSVFSFLQLTTPVCVK